MSEEKQYYLHNYETGHQVLVSKEVWERYTAAMKQFFGKAMPKLDEKYRGTLIVDTAGAFDDPGGYRELWLDTDLSTLRGKPCTSSGITYFVPAYQSPLDEFGKPIKP